MYIHYHQLSSESGTGSGTAVAASFETVSKNLAAYPADYNYDGQGRLSSIEYTTGTGAIVKTLTWNASSQLESVTLEGDVPSGVFLRKEFTWSNGQLVSVQYSAT